MLDIVKKYKEQEKEIERLKLVINDYIVDLIDIKTSYNQLAREYEKVMNMYEMEKQIVVADELKIMNAIDRLNALIIFWKKYNPIDNTMQIEQFNGVIEILEGVKQ